MMMDSIAILPFHISADLVQPHLHIHTGGGRTFLSRSYVSKSASTSPKGTRESDIAVGLDTDPM